MRNKENYGIAEVESLINNYSERVEAMLRETPEDKKGKKFSCWAVLENDEYIPSYHTIQGVPSGVYEIAYNSKLSMVTLKKQPFKTDELYSLPSAEIIDIVKDIDNFWNMRNQYEKYRFIHKRGILMFGEPGCGKSGIIQMVSKNII